MRPPLSPFIIITIIIACFTAARTVLVLPTLLPALQCSCNHCYRTTPTPSRLEAKKKHDQEASRMSSLSLLFGPGQPRGFRTRHSRFLAKPFWPCVCSVSLTAPHFDGLTFCYPSPSCCNANALVSLSHFRQVRLSVRHDVVAAPWSDRQTRAE